MSSLGCAGLTAVSIYLRIEFRGSLGTRLGGEPGDKVGLQAHEQAQILRSSAGNKGSGHNNHHISSTYPAGST